MKKYYNYGMILWCENRMTKRTFVTKSGDTYEWEETPELVDALQNLTYAGDYKGPLYAQHPDLKEPNERPTSNS